MIARDQSLRYLTGMRGFAALMVFAIHWVGVFFPKAPQWIMDFVYLGPQGVVVFFTLSAFSLSMSVETRNLTWREYASRRFMRIAPPSYFCLVAALLVGRISYWSAHFATPFDFKSFVWHLTFTNWIDYRHTNNAIGVEWTLSVEVIFYLFLPLLLSASKNIFGCIILVGAAIALQRLQDPSLPVEAWQWSPAPFAVCFVIGVITWRIWQRLEIPSYAGWPTLAFVVAVLIVLKPHWGFENGVTAWSVGAALLILTGRSRAGVVVFGNNISFLIGERSYSIYLVHLAVISVVAQVLGAGPAQAALALIGTVVGTEILFRFVEAPSQRYASRHSAPAPAE